MERFRESEKRFIRRLLPAWERGSKRPRLRPPAPTHEVAPRVGAWIETRRSRSLAAIPSVAPRVGAWIETPIRAGGRRFPRCRSPRGNVDRNVVPPAMANVLTQVAPRVGAWIETGSWLRGRQGGGCRSPRGSVDRNYIQGAVDSAHLLVAPRVGAWIETQPTRDRRSLNRVAPRVGAWIETRQRIAARAPRPSRSPRGSVDRNNRTSMRLSDRARVAPRVGAWIETP